VAADWLSSGVVSVGAPQEPGVELAVELLPRQVPALVLALRLTGSPVAEELPAWPQLGVQCPS